MRALPLLMIALLAACGDSTEPAPTGTGTPLGVDRVLDGDSFLGTIDGGEVEIRLLGINAPDRDECHAQRSRSALSEFLDDGVVTVTVVETDRFGRELAYVEAGAGDVNLAMVERGNAIALGGDHERRTAYLDAESRAHSAGAGLFRRDACGPDTAGVEITDLSFDPAGPDEQALEDEWAEITNSEAPLDMSGWILRDESSSNRYEFPAGFVLDSDASVRVIVGCGDDGPARLHWCNGSPVWNNGGDAALLLDPHGNVSARLRYAP